MSSKVAGRQCLEKDNVNSEKFVSILENFLIPSLKDQFRDNDVTFVDDSALCHRSWIVKNVLYENNIPHIEWPACSPDVNPIKEKKKKKNGI